MGTEEAKDVVMLEIEAVAPNVSTAVRALDLQYAKTSNAKN